MNRLLRTFFIFLFLLSTRSAIGQTVTIEQEANEAYGSYSAKIALTNNLEGLAAIESMQYQQPKQTSTTLSTH